jgi:hypothetical protein
MTGAAQRGCVQAVVHQRNEKDGEGDEETDARAQSGSGTKGRKKSSHSRAAIRWLLG